MVKIGVAEILESLGLKDHGTSGYQARAVFHYEPLLRLYKLEIPSLFGRLIRDEGIFLDRADPDLFQTELDELLTELGPLIWPLPGQGPRDHLLKPVAESRYTSDLVYLKDKDILISHLRNLILSKRARPDIDVDAFIEKRHKDANLKIFNKPDPGHPQTSKSTTESRRKSAKSGGKVRSSRQILLTDESSDLSETAGDSGAESEYSIVRPTARRRVKASNTSVSFQVALRLFRKTSPEELSSTGPCHSYGTVFIDEKIDLAAHCFAHIDLHTDTKCAYIEFHPPEDMSLRSRIRIDRDSEEADETFEQVITMLREARKFPGEPSYRTVEVEIGTETMSEE